MNEESLIPASAKLVFKGILFEIWQWEQKMYDGSIRTFERAKRFDSVNVIAVVGDKILIQEQEQPAKPGPYFSLPGGRVEDKEPLEEAKRELLEETGYASNDWEHLSTELPSSFLVFKNFIYVARNCKFVAEPKFDGGEKIKTDLVNFEEFLKLVENPLFRIPFSLTKNLLRMRIYPKEKEEFYNLLYSK